MKIIKETSSVAGGSVQGGSGIIPKRPITRNNAVYSDIEPEDELEDIPEADVQAEERKKMSIQSQQLEKLTNGIIQENMFENDLFRLYFTKKIAKNIILKEYSSNSTGIDLLLRTFKKIENPIKEWFLNLKTNPEQRQLYQDSFFLRLKRFIELLNVDQAQAGEFIKAMKSNQPQKEEQGTALFTDDEIQTGKRKYKDIIGDIDPAQFNSEDLTGYNFAKEAFKYVSSQIQNDYLLLSNKKDRIVYYQYLIIHLSYRFAQWSEEANIGGNL